MTLFQIFVDEDTMDAELVMALQSRGFPVLTPGDTNLLGAADDVVLQCATERGYVLYSQNVRDFLRLHTAWVAASRDHAGIIVAPQQLSIGDQLRWLSRIRNEIGAERMRNRLEFLKNWG